MVEMLNLYSSRWLLYFGMTVLQNTIFLAVLFLCFALLERASAHVKYAVGLLGLIKLLLPPFIPAALSNLLSGSTLPSGLMETGSPLPIAAVSQAIEVSARPELSLKSTIFLVWAGAALLYVVLALALTWLLRLKLKRAVVLEEAPGRRVRLFQSSLISSPLSIGLAPRQIFVPTYWRTLPGECRSVLLKHELAHLKRRDGLVQGLQILAQAVYFFHPLVWLLNERLNEYREMACDDAALRETNMSPEVYSQYLLHVAERVTHPHWSYVSASALIKQKNKLLQRIHYQIREAAMKSSTKNVAVVFVLLAVLIAPLSLYSKKSADDSEKPSSVLINQEEESLKPQTKAVERESKKIAYDTAPKPVGGFAAIQKNVRYPESARKAGIEGRVFINAHIGKDGEVKETKILKSLGNNSCDEAAVKAIKATKWEPARKNGKPVAVWVGVPVIFKLNNEKGEAAPPSSPVEDEGSMADVSSSFEVAYDTPPQPIGGFAELQRWVRYPEQARKDGVEGSVYVSVLIDEQGEVEKTEIENSLGDNGCDETAIYAIKKVKWNPAIKDGKPVKAWIGVPIVFGLGWDEKTEQEQKNGIDRTEWKQLGFQSLTFTDDLKFLEQKKSDIIYYCEFNRDGTVKDADIVKSSGDKEYDQKILEYFQKHSILGISDKIAEPIMTYVSVVLGK